ncbi:MAG TPA: DUF1015 domain-containing protein [Terriglobales bacterium]|nr:DUF1015 domain-containing protein [Terriglobales bacterium]
MAEIFPFRGLRFNPARVEVALAVTQPYDKITPAMQARYYDASPYNLVRIILGRSEAEDSEGSNVYTRAAEYFRDWREQEILRAEDEPAIYAYSQRFAVPGGTRELERRGFIALGRVVPYREGVVYRHEQTLAKPRADRLNLLRATRAHFGQIFMVYSDPEKKVEAALQVEREPDICVTDEYGVRHSVWRVVERERIQAVVAAMSDKKLIIADGHHRYETALAYAEETRAAGGAPAAAEIRETQATAPARAPGPTQYENVSRSGKYPAHELVMMTLVNMDAEGLVILPTHRVVFGLPGFDADLLLRSLWGYFQIEQLPASLDAAQLTAKLAEAGREGSAFVAVTRNDRYLLRAKDDGGLLDAVSPRQRQLDLVRLHKVVLEHVLGLSEDDIRQQRHVSYYRDAGEAIARVRQDANVAFLVNPVTIEQVREVALAGEVLPQKSTDFYPKMLSGLTIYALD